MSSTDVIVLHWREFGIKLVNEGDSACYLELRNILIRDVVEVFEEVLVMTRLSKVEPSYATRSTG
jgi:hypothetical protein